jgi:hypothetical protein
MIVDLTKNTSKYKSIFSKNKKTSKKERFLKISGVLVKIHQIMGEFLGVLRNS